jgi:hypothetical protein
MATYKHRQCKYKRKTIHRKKSGGRNEIDEWEDKRAIFIGGLQFVINELRSKIENHNILTDEQQDEYINRINDFYDEASEIDEYFSRYPSGYHPRGEMQDKVGRALDEVHRLLGLYNPNPQPITQQMNTSNNTNNNRTIINNSMNNNNNNNSIFGGKLNKKSNHKYTKKRKTLRHKTRRVRGGRASPSVKLENIINNLILQINNINEDNIDCWEKIIEILKVIVEEEKFNRLKSKVQNLQNLINNKMAEIENYNFS